MRYLGLLIIMQNITWYTKTSQHSVVTLHEFAENIYLKARFNEDETVQREPMKVGNSLSFYRHFRGSQRSRLSKVDGREGGLGTFIKVPMLPLKSVYLWCRLLGLKHFKGHVSLIKLTSVLASFIRLYEEKDDHETEVLRTKHFACPNFTNIQNLIWLLRYFNSDQLSTTLVIFH